uniref:Uncharacterized protein n=1 Tax=Lepeophtheirus salmonis TaxID=72036 RepID=A0A0K2VAU6_LEPSM
MIIRDTPPDSITLDSPTNQHVDLKEFIDIMSTGGLSTPSYLLYLSCQFKQDSLNSNIITVQLFFKEFHSLCLMSWVKI